VTRTPQLIESEIAEVEKRLTALSEELSRPDVARDPSRVTTLNDEYQQADARLRTLYEEWERIAAEAANA
jgi:protein subunit release factor A